MTYLLGDLDERELRDLVEAIRGYAHWLRKSSDAEVLKAIMRIDNEDVVVSFIRRPVRRADEHA